MASKICKKEVKQQASGQWDSVIRKLAPSLAPALDHPGVHIDCPIHGGKMDFRCYRDVDISGGGVCTCGIYPDGIALIGAANGWSFLETLEEVAELVMTGSSTGLIRAAPVVKRSDTRKEDEAIRKRLRALWKGSMPLTHPDAIPAVRYLIGRGLHWPCEVQSLRFHPALAYHVDGVFTGHHPGLVALVRSSSGVATTVHRTFLTVDGQKAAVDAPKKLCSHASDRPLSGSAITLFSPQRRLAVAEGIETAMAVSQLTGIPCWATVTAGLMAQFVPPPGVEQVIVFADKDRPSKFHPEGHGQESARILTERMWAQGIKAGIRLPPVAIPDDKKNVDWLDFLLQRCAA